jgi:predicted nuclease with TOPRIM domain
MQENSYLESKIQNLQDELDKVRQNKTGITDQLNKTIQEKFHLESKLENLNKKLDKVRQADQR